MTHNGVGNYFDTETRLPNGQSYLDHTLTTVAQVLTAQGLVAQDPRPPLSQP